MNRLRKTCLTALLSIILSTALFSCSEEGTVESRSSGPLHTEGELEAHFIDVGQADCTLLVSDGEAVLVDAGNREDDELIIEYLRTLGIEDLKYIVFTHPHEDHIGSGEAIIDEFPVEKIFMLDEYDDGIEGDLKEAIDEKGIETEAPVPEDSTAFGACSVEFLGPVEEYSDANDDSICLKVSHGENSILFTGDAGRTPEKAMIENSADLEADILKAGHHGSSTANSYYFLRESNPRFAVISCGEGNMYGHPHEETMSRLSDLGAEVFRTDLQGTVIAVSDGAEITFNCEGKKAEQPHLEEYEDAAYIGNVNSKKYHSPDCGGLPKEENRAYFMSVEAAEEAGYTPCGNCEPQ